MEIDDLPYRKLKTLLKEDHLEVSLNLRVAALFLVAFENLKELVTTKVQSFFTTDFDIVDGELAGKPSAEYGALLKGKSVYRACRDFHLEMGAMTPDDDKLLDEFNIYRGEVAHELYAILLDDQKSPLDIDLLMKAHLLARKIDTWWILNFEIPLNPDFDNAVIDESGVTSGRQLFVDQLFRVALKDVIESSESERTDA